MKWLQANIQDSPDSLVIRTQDACLICLVNYEFACPQSKYGAIPVVIGKGHIWEAVKLVRVAMAWAKTRGAKRFIMASDPDVPDIEMIARRVGLAPAQATYEGEI